MRRSEDVYVYCTAQSKYSSRCTLNLFTHNIQCVSTIPRRNAPVDRKQYIEIRDILLHMSGSVKGSDADQKQNLTEK